MNKSIILWRDMCGLSKDLCEILENDYGKKPFNLSYCVDIVNELNKRFERQPKGHNNSDLKNNDSLFDEMVPETGPTSDFHHDKTPFGNIPFGLTDFKGLWKKREKVYLDNNTLREHILFLGDAGSGQNAALLSLAANASATDRGIFFLDRSGDTSSYIKMMGCLGETGRLGDLHVINLLAPDNTHGKTGHTVDLFQRMTWTDLAEWMVFMGPSAHLEKHREAWDEWCPRISRLVFHYAIASQQKITPRLIHDALSYDGARRFIQNLPPEVAEFSEWDDLLQALKNPYDDVALAFKCLQKYIEPLATKYGELFNSPTPEFGFPLSLLNKKIVLVLAGDSGNGGHFDRVALSAITASLLIAAKKTPKTKSVANVFVFDQFENAVNEPLLIELSKTRDLGVGMIFSEMGAPSARTRMDWKNMGEWMAPRTCVVMHQNFQLLKNDFLSPLASCFNEIEKLPPGHAFFWVGEDVQKISLNYREPKIFNTSFICHITPPPPEQLLTPEPLLKIEQKSGARRKDKQAVVLYNRIENLEDSGGNIRPPKLSWCQETVARMMGFAHWHEAQIRCGAKN